MRTSGTGNSARGHLAERVRAILGPDPRLTERPMFGSLAFLLNGHILAGIRKDGSMLLSVGRGNNAAALERAGTTQMVMREKAMPGFVQVEGEAIEDDEALADWLRFAEQWVATLPPR